MSRLISASAHIKRWQYAIIADLAPGYFALVMATGIIAVGLQLHGLHAPALALSRFNIVAYIALVTLHGLRLVLFPSRAVADFTDHAVGPGYFTWVAATGVLGNQLLLVHGNAYLAWGLWFAALALWFTTTYGLFSAFVVKPYKPTLAAGLNGSWLLAVVRCSRLLSWLLSWR